MKIEEAIAIARKWHGDQTDQLGDDYVNGHLRRVAMALYDNDSKPDLIAAGALHDSLEDTGCTPDDLRQAGISEESIRIIDIVTRRPDEPYELFIGRVIEGGQSPIEVKLADIADYLDGERLSRLPPDTAERLEQKYSAARGRLLEALA